MVKGGERISKDVKRGRVTYQFVIPPELHERMETLREEFPGFPSPANELRMALDAWVTMMESGAAAVRQGDSAEDLRQALATALGGQLLDAITTPKKRGGGSG